MRNAAVDTTKPKRSGDAAVDGLGRGLIAGLLMGAYLLAVGMLSGAALPALMARFAAVDGNPPALIGALTHLGTSAVYGALFGVLWHAAVFSTLDGLSTGTYTFYCAVPGHRAAGMEGTLVVK